MLDVFNIRHQKNITAVQPFELKFIINANVLVGVNNYESVNKPIDIY